MFSRNELPRGGGRPPRGPLGGAARREAWGGKTAVGTHTTDYTKPRQTIQSPKKTIQSPRKTRETFKILDKTSKYETNTQNI